LHARPDDLVATEELQAVVGELAALDADSGDDDRPRRLRRSGLSFFDRLRERRHRHRASTVR
jgi:hypothetical protein